MEGSLGYMLKLFQSKIPSLNYSGTTFFRKTAKFRRFFLGKLLELLAINHSSSGRRDIFVLWLLKIFHALVILHFAWVHTSPQLSWTTRSDLATISRCQASCDTVTQSQMGLQVRSSPSICIFDTDFNYVIKGIRRPRNPAPKTQSTPKAPISVGARLALCFWLRSLFCRLCLLLG